MAWTALPARSVGEVWTAAKQTVVDNDITWLGTRKGCTIRRAATVSVASGSVATVTFDTEDSDTDAFFAPSSTTVTIPTGLGGIYAITFTTSWAVTNQVSGFIRLTAGGNAYDVSTPGVVTGAGGGSFVIPLAAADTITIGVLQNSGAAQTLNSARLQVYWVGR
ncbi:MAG: hypothetical protein RJA49_2044 [Actinomycetota bacterium]